LDNKDFSTLCFYRHINSYTIRAFVSHSLYAIPLNRQTHSIIEQLAFHAQPSVQDTSAQDLNPRPCADNARKSVLVHEMMVIEPGENATRTLIWKQLKPMDFLSHIKCRTNDDLLPLTRWETWFCSRLGDPIPALVGPPQPCSCRVFHHDHRRTISRHVRLNRRLWHHLLTTGSFIRSVLSLSSYLVDRTTSSSITH
jgi:hypothetical protein